MIFFIFFFWFIFFYTVFFCVFCFLINLTNNPWNNEKKKRPTRKPPLRTSRNYLWKVIEKEKFFLFPFRLLLLLHPFFFSAGFCFFLYPSICCSLFFFLFLLLPWRGKEREEEKKAAHFLWRPRGLLVVSTGHEDNNFNFSISFHFHFPSLFLSLSLFDSLTLLTFFHLFSHSRLGFPLFVLFSLFLSLSSFLQGRRKRDFFYFLLLHPFLLPSPLFLLMSCWSHGF
ncbi:uncharacterized protein PWA37_000485 [Arxiozyma heterogenica]|uniref:uncharacterized protein n=1 Tax=Arxiozyma heterogenica TaxID=278026 RepID=UPI002EEEC671